MAYYEGQVNNFSQLADVAGANLLANGWVQVGNYFVKGRSAFTFIRNTDFLGVGAGIYNGSAVVDTHNGPSRIRNAQSVMIFPINFRMYINTDPDEVYIIVNYNVEYYQFIGFGVTYQTDPLGCPWFTGSYRAGYQHRINIRIREDFFDIAYCDVTCSGGMFSADVDQYVSSSFTYCNINGTYSWYSHAPNFNYKQCSSYGFMLGPLQCMPSQSGMSVALLPIIHGRDAGGNGIHFICKTAHSRLTRNDYILSGNSIQFGHDTWDVYPLLRRNPSARNGSGGNGSGYGADHSGTFAYAIRRVE